MKVSKIVQETFVDSRSKFDGRVLEFLQNSQTKVSKPVQETFINCSWKFSEAAFPKKNIYVDYFLTVLFIT